MQFETDLKSPHKDLYLATRDVILGFEGIEETRKPRITTYGLPGGGICHMRTMPEGVDVGLLKGSLLDDRYDLLVTRGSSKRIRVYSFDQLDEAKLSYYLEQSIALVE